MPGEKVGMKIWLKRVAIGLACTVALIVVVGLLLPTTYTVSRSIIIEADPGDIHEYVGDLRKWDLWTPWKDEDPTIVVRFGEKTSGVGASQSWVGEDGQGSLRFTMWQPSRGIEYDLDLSGGGSTCRSAMRYHATEDNTRVTWILKGDLRMPLIGGYQAIMMDSLVGEMFERGLGKLKKTVEDQVNSF